MISLDSSKLLRLQQDYHQRLGRWNELYKRVEDGKARLEQIAVEEDTTTKASLFLQTLSDTTRTQVIDRISAIVTDALKKVKDRNLEFRMVLSTERNQTDLKFLVYDAVTQKEYDVIDSYGGGIADLITFALRVSLLLKWSPSLSRVLIMDENFKFVSVQDQEILADFVRTLSEQLGLQIILVTHSGTLSNKAHRVFGVSKVGDTSKIEVRV